MHEAGHVVTAVIQGMAINYATISADGIGVSGYTEIRIGQGGDDKERAIAEAHTTEMLRQRTIQALAGSAETLIHADHEKASAGAQDDHDRAMRFALMAVDGDVPAASTFLTECDREARRLIATHVVAVQQVANCLLGFVNKHVDGDALVALVREHQAR